MKTYISIAAKLLVVIAFMQATPSLAKVVLDQEDLPISSLCQESEDGNAYFLEDPEDCSQYYMCQPTLDPVEPWIAINMTCPGNLQFDTNLNVCNYAQVVGCVDKDTAIKAAKSFEPEEESSTWNPISDLCQESPEDGLAYFLADPDNCSHYYMCQPTLDLDAPWIAISMTCAGDLQFDPDWHVCNYAEEVGCVDKETKTIYKAAKSFEPEEESSTGDPISELCQEPSEDGLAYFLADPDNCSEYYVCQLNVVDFEYQWIAIHMSCPAPLQFDTNLNVCNYADVVGCVDN